MGYELWLSEVTGRRRRGTRLIELHRLLDEVVNVAAVFEPLMSCAPNAAAEEAKYELERRDFDVAGVRAERCAPVIGLVEKSALTNGLIQNHVRTINPEDKIDESESLRSAMTRLREKPFVLVTVGGSIEGILTRADLNKPVARIHMFGAVSLLEMHMSFWTRTEFPDDSWQNVISKGRLNKAKDLQLERSDLSLFDLLQYSDRIDLFTRIDRVREELGLGSRKHAIACLKKAEKLRNDIAHAQHYLAKHDSWPDVIALLEWIERVVSKSDALSEARAEALSVGYVSSLW